MLESVPVARFIERVFRRYKNSIGVYSGVWVQLPDTKDSEVKKIDIVYLLKDGYSLEGLIEREQPYSDEKKRWRFIGRLQDSFLYGFFHGISGNNVDSHGLIELYFKDGPDCIFEGHYKKIVKVVSDEEGAKKTIQLQPAEIDLTWRRKGALPFWKRIKMVFIGM